MFSVPYLKLATHRNLLFFCFSSDLKRNRMGDWQTRMLQFRKCLAAQNVGESRQNIRKRKRVGITSITTRLSKEKRIKKKMKRINVLTAYRLGKVCTISIVDKGIYHIRRSKCCLPWNWDTDDANIEMKKKSNFLDMF